MGLWSRMMATTATTNKKGREQLKRHGCLPFTRTKTRRCGNFKGRAFFFSFTESHCSRPFRISTTGASEYKLNDKVVTYSAYNTALVSHNILVKAKNFLVFQGDVEAVAQQSPRELSRLIEQISGSLELAGEYEKAKGVQDRATENATFNFNKRRGIAGEIKQYKEQKGEAERFEQLVEKRVRLITRNHRFHPHS